VVCASVLALDRAMPWLERPSPDCAIGRLTAPAKQRRAASKPSLSLMRRLGRAAAMIVRDQRPASSLMAGSTLIRLAHGLSILASTVPRSARDSHQGAVSWRFQTINSIIRSASALSKRCTIKRLMMISFPTNDGASCLQRWSFGCKDRLCQLR
jgi:hypothetical protein